MCHFCGKRVYLMERLSAEGRFFHRGCFRCEYCGISLRLGEYEGTIRSVMRRAELILDFQIGNYSFDRDGKYGSRFYCTQHLGYPGSYRTKLKNRQNDYKNDNGTNDKENDSIPKTPTLVCRRLCHVFIFPRPCFDLKFRFSWIWTSAKTRQIHRKE